MLTLTPTAAEAVRGLVASSQMDDEGGVRIEPGATTAAALQLTLVDGPEAADQAVEELGVHVFLEPTVAEFLDDKVLDAQIPSRASAIPLTAHTSLRGVHRPDRPGAAVLAVPAACAGAGRVEPDRQPEQDAGKGRSAQAGRSARGRASL